MHLLLKQSNIQVSVTDCFVCIFLLYIVRYMAEDNNKDFVPGD